MDVLQHMADWKKFQVVALRLEGGQVEAVGIRLPWGGQVLPSKEKGDHVKLLGSNINWAETKRQP